MVKYLWTTDQCAKIPYLLIDDFSRVVLLFQIYFPPVPAIEAPTCHFLLVHQFRVLLPAFQSSPILGHLLNSINYTNVVFFPIPQDHSYRPPSSAWVLAWRNKNLTQRTMLFIIRKQRTSFFFFYRSFLTRDNIHQWSSVISHWWMDWSGRLRLYWLILKLKLTGAGISTHCQRVVTTEFITISTQW